MDAASKVCTGCGQVKPLTDYGKRAASRDGLQYKCKSCVSTYGASYFQQNRERKAEYQRAWVEANRDRHNARTRQWYAEHPGRQVIVHRKWRYGLSEEEYNRLWEAQGGTCAICGEPDPARHTLSVDHDHATGAIRGLLCTKHNSALGLLNDDLELVERAAAYLRRYAAPPATINEAAG